MDEKVKISVGDLQNGVTEIIRENKRIFLIYLAIMVPLVCAASIFDGLLGWLPQNMSNSLLSITSFSRENGPIGLIVWIASVVGHYMLFERILLGPNADIPNRGGRMLGFFGLAIVSYLGVFFATILLIVPGLFIAGRWLLAPAFFVEQGEGVFSSLGQSWDHVRGNTRTIVLAYLVLFLLFIVGAVVVNIPIAMIGLPFIAAILDAALGEVFGLLLIALSIAAYRLLAVSAQRVSEVFG